MYLLVIAALLIPLLLHYWWSIWQFSKRNLPFSWPLPVVGNNLRTLFRWTTFPHHVLDLYNKFKGYPYCGVFDFSSRLVMIRDPEVIKNITVKDFDHFTDHRTAIPEEIEPMMARNVFSLKGQKWKTARTTLSPAFTSSKMKYMFQLVSVCGKQLTSHIDKQLQQEEGGVLKVDLKDFYTRFTNDVIATTAFGISCNSLEEKNNTFYKMGRKVTRFSRETLLRFLACMSFPKIVKLLKMKVFPEDAMSFFKHLINDTVETRENKNIIRPDMIHLMMEARKVQKDLTNDDIAAQAFIFFFAGFETTSTLLCFSTLLLAMHPEVQKKLQGHIDEVFDDEEQTITYEALHELAYLDMFISETLRLYAPAIATDRVCVKKYTIPAAEGRPQLTIEEGEIVWIPVIGLHMDPEYFPDPSSFRPERFSEENKHDIKPFTYLPFGVGPRSCIGNRFALMETKVALVHLLSRFDFQVIDKTPLPIKLTDTMQVEGGFWLGLAPRNKPTTHSGLRSRAYCSKMYLLVIAALLIPLLLHYWWSIWQFSKRNLPFSWPLPVVGNNLGTLIRRNTFPEQILKMYNDFKGHPYYGVFEFTSRIVMIRDPEVIKNITVKDFDHFTDHRTAIPEEIEPMMAKNVFGLKGQKWKTARTTLSPAFTSSKMKNMFQLVSECGKQLTSHIAKQLQQEESGVLKVDMKDFYTRFTNDVIATTAFGISCNSLEEKDNTFYKMGRKVTRLSGKTLFLFFACMSFPNLLKLLKIKVFPKDATSFFKHLIYDTIETRENKNIIRPDMIHLLMEAKKVQKDLTNDDIAAQAFIFFFAGFETTSTLLCFSTLLLAMHPEVQKKLQGHIDEVFDDEEQTITYEALHELAYLDMVISETLRLYTPAVATDRVCVKRYTVPAAEGRPQLTIEKGEIVMIPVIGLHMDPEYFPDPSSFRPERFSEENKHDIKPFTYLPFGVGPRSCIANRFALMEAKVALVHLLSRFDFQVIDKTPLPIKLTDAMQVKGGFWLGLAPRNKPTTH
ncbi:uncharacterized protein LOC134537257 [Bacillus rossius redtenbacheri]|uniref:uncharacterized protein LOC134537257 n=1 Tax=Bacillus rossius redtenbacheri TaxID=93214 RepID=UPI002FDE7D69